MTTKSFVFSSRAERASIISAQEVSPWTLLYENHTIANDNSKGILVFTDQDRNTVSKSLTLNEYLKEKAQIDGYNIIDLDIKITK